MTKDEIAILLKMLTVAHNPRSSDDLPRKAALRSMSGNGRKS